MLVQYEYTQYHCYTLIQIFFPHNMYLIQHNRHRSIYYWLNTLENVVPQYIAGILVEVMLQLRRYVGYQEILEFYLINRVHILGFSLHILWAVFPEREDSHCLIHRMYGLLQCGLTDPSLKSFYAAVQEMFESLIWWWQVDINELRYHYFREAWQLTDSLLSREMSS